MVQVSSVPCGGFPVAVRYLDVTPDILADEAAREAPATYPAGDVWRSYLVRVLPAADPASASAVAARLLCAGTGEPAALAHAHAMRRAGLAGGDVRRARFWAEVAACIAADEA
jgi:hypothetical protein